MLGHRIYYIDALKSISIFMIVFNHVRIFSFGIEADTSAISILFTTVMVPLFFFLSGFFCKIIPDDSEKFRWLLTNIKNKFRQLIIPTVIFYGLSRGAGIYNWSFPGGFWFTYVLFLMFLVTYLVFLVFPRKLAHNGLIWTIWTLAALILVLNHIGKDYLHDHQVNNFCNNYIFFATGLVYKNIFHLRHNWKVKHVEVLFVIFVLLFIIQYRGLLVNAAGIVWKINAMVLILLLLHLFHGAQNRLIEKNRLSRIVLYAGRHTLSIYMIHYFLLPVMPMCTIYPDFQYANSLLEFVWFGSIAVLIILASLLIEIVVCQFGSISNWLFGTKLMI